MSNSFAHAPRHHAYLWISFEPESLRKMRAAVAKIPIFPGARVSSFCDGETLLFGIAYDSIDGGTSLLRTWAQSEGFELICTDHWSADRRQRFVTETLRFHCRGGRGLLDGAVHDLAERLARGPTSHEAAPQAQTLYGTSVSRASTTGATLLETIQAQLRAERATPRYIKPQRTKTWTGFRA